MPFAQGTRIGHYEVGAQIGAGGMGEVYRARDVQLGREVALKVLPESCVTDPERIARLVREAQTLASLNHPNIGAIHGLERTTGVTALVLELVEGPTLADRIGEGPIDVDEALEIAEQIALALEAAHEQGIVHRDVKPSNIKLRPDGTVKVLDFGLAKALASDPREVLDGPSNSPTITTPALSRVGVILGTGAYMSPEQARGRPLDKRTDIWAFGCVLFEMLTGRRAFQGDDTTDVIAAVLMREPDFASLPPRAPWALRRLIERCLRKDRHTRLRDIGDARLEIRELRENAGAEPASAPTLPRRVRTERIVWLALLAAALALATYGMIQGPLASDARSESRAEIVTPPTPLGAGAAAISPDGTTIAFAAYADGRLRLWLRELAADAPRPLSGTDGANLPFWSPDSRSIGFFADNWLKRVDLDGGAVRVLAPVLRGTGGTWNRDGVIVFSSLGDPIARVEDSGGRTSELTGLFQQGSNFSPAFLPDGRRFLYHVRGTADTQGLYVGALDGSVPPRRLVEANAGAVYAPSGHLLYVRDRNLLAQPFDPDTLQLTGKPFTVVTNCQCQTPSVSSNGTITYRRVSADFTRRFTWYDRAGKEIRRLDGRTVGSPSLSKDDSRVLGYTGSPVDGNVDVWIFDLDRAASTRLTLSVGDDVTPVWSPDESRIAFASNRTNVKHDLFIKPATAAGGEEVLLSSPEEKTVDDWSADGRYVLFDQRSSERRSDLMAVEVEPPNRVIPVSRTDYDEARGQFSPDGQWVAYQSDATGRPEIHLQPFPGPGKEIVISSGGGTQVRWRGDGTELFYVTLDGRLMAVSVGRFMKQEAAGPEPPIYVFTPPLGGNVQYGDYRHQYDVSSDGKRFLVAAASQPDANLPIGVIFNWTGAPHKR